MYHHVKNPLVKKVNFVKNVTYEVLSRLRRYGITQCYLPPDTSERARLTLAMQAGTRFTYPGGMEG